MGSKLANKKRKADVPESESENELAAGAFEGVLSGSEDELDLDDLDFSDDDAEDESDASDDGADDGDDDAILSDDIPSDLEDEYAMGKLSKQTEELEIEVPGVDPKPKDVDDEDRNYRIEKDANGGDRYVYECVHSAHHLAPRNCARKLT